MSMVYLVLQACMLKRIQKHPTDGDVFSSSDSNTYYSDDFSCSDDSGSSGEDGTFIQQRNF